MTGRNNYSHYPPQHPKCLYYVYLLFQSYVYIISIVYSFQLLYLERVFAMILYIIVQSINIQYNTICCPRQREALNSSFYLFFYFFFHFNRLAFNESLLCIVCKVSAWACEKVASDLWLGGVFAGYSGFLHYLQLASHELAIIWHYCDEKRNFQVLNIGFSIERHVGHSIQNGCLTKISVEGINNGKLKTLLGYQDLQLSNKTKVIT